MPAHDLWRASARLCPDGPGVSDGDLLDRFRTARDEAAFELLVYRHGPMVWAACRRLLSDRHAAEDAFQATFLALARKARTIRRTASVPTWLHRVAVRAGLRIRRTRPTPVPLVAELIEPAPGPAERAAAADLAGRLDAAVNRLPERFRRVFVACELQGVPLAEVAVRFRCPVGTIASRLARARERLRYLLQGTACVVTAETVPPALRAAVIQSTCRGAAVRPGVEALSRHASAGGSTAGLVGTLAAGLLVVVIALGVPGDPPPKAVPTETKADSTLPTGALARVGSDRFRTDGWYFGGYAFSPDGTLIAGGSVKTRLSVWETATGKELVTVQAPSGPFGEVRFTPDGKYFVAGRHAKPRGHEICCYEARTGREVFRFGGEDKLETWPRWTVGTTGALFVLDKANTVLGFELPGGRPICRTPLPDGAKFASWAPDGSRLFFSTDKRIGVFDSIAAKETWTLARAGQKNFAFATTPDGKRVVTWDEGRLRVHDLATGKVGVDVRPIAATKLNNDLLSISHDRYVVLRPDSRTGLQDLIVVDLDRGTVVVNLPAFHGWSWPVFSPDGRSMILLDSNVDTTVWELAKPAAPVARLGRASSVRFSADGRILAADGHGCLGLYDTRTWKPLPQSASPRSNVNVVRFTADGRGLIARTGEGWRAWDDWTKPDSRLIFGHADGHRSVHSAMSEDGRTVAEGITVSGLGPGDPKVAQVRVTDRRTGRVRSHDGARWANREVILSEDGRRAFTWLMEVGELRGWDTATGEAVRPWVLPEAFKDHEMAVAISRDGRWVALIPDQNLGKPRGDDILLWDVEQGKPAGRIKDARSFGADSQTAQFSRDGRRLAALVHPPHPDVVRTEARVWDWRTGRQLMAVPAPYSYLGTIALSPDGRSVAIGEENGHVRVFEVASGQERASFRHGSRIFSVAFHPDGTKLAASSPDAPIFVWDLQGSPGRWDATKADAAWADLGSADAKVAHVAIRRLRASAADAVPFLETRLRLSAPTDDQVRGWLKTLDADRFADRERAQKELTAVADVVRPRLAAARKEASPEAGRRLDQIIAAADEWTPDRLRQVRACEVLEAIGTPEAMRVLRAWAAGPVGARRTVDAAEALDRPRP
jgi:RNA polymerase sigma factor (sigma-70 family)